MQHWISFITVARPRIRSAIREGIQDTFLYHGNSKVATVLQRSDTNTYQVHLMTFTAKGSPKRDLCVYLTHKEYEELEKIIPQINECLENASPQTKKTFCTAYQWILVPYEEADMEVCTKYYFLKEHAMQQGVEAAYNAEVNVDRIDIIKDFIPLPEAINFLKSVYMVMLHRACQYINNYMCTACQKHLPPHDTYHVTAAEGCKVTDKDLVGDCILFAREMCPDEFMKKIFLACWKKLELSMVNVDSLLQDIHLLWDDMETNDIVKFQVKRLDNAESKEDSNVMLIDEILMEEKFRDGVIVFMNDRRDKSAEKKRKCKEVSGSQTLSKKRCFRKRNEQVHTTKSPSIVDDGSKDDDDMEMEDDTSEDRVF